MKTGERLQQEEQDATLRLKMRVIGILLATASIVFMQQDIFTGTLSIWFFGTCTGLGVITVISSWLPGPEQVRIPEKAVAQPVQRKSPHRVG